MSDGQRDPLSVAVGRLVSRLAGDPDVRAALRALAELVLESTETPATPADPDNATESATEADAPQARTEAPVAEPSSDPVAPPAVPPPPPLLCRYRRLPRSGRGRASRSGR